MFVLKQCIFAFTTATVTSLHNTSCPGSLFELGKRSPGPKFKPTSSAKIAHAVFTPCPAEKTVSRKRRQRAGFAPICANRSSLTPKCPFRANVVASSKFAASWSCLCVKSFRAQALCAFPSSCPRLALAVALGVVVTLRCLALHSQVVNHCQLQKL